MNLTLFQGHRSLGIVPFANCITCFYTHDIRVTVSCKRVCVWRGHEFVFLSASDGNCHGLQLLTGQRAWTSWVHESVQHCSCSPGRSNVAESLLSWPGPFVLLRVGLSAWFNTASSVRVSLVDFFPRALARQQ